MTKAKSDLKKKPRKIAIIGTAPQWQLAPFDDPSWEIWGIFGVVGCNKRLDRLYEIHDKSIIAPMAEKHYPDGKYWTTAKALGKNFITKDPYEQAPDASRFDFQSKLDKYGPYFASSASWLLADAIDQEPAEIGIWGVNMSSDGEYAHQKPSCTYLLGFAKAKGIRITLPASSELMSISHQYGLQPPPAFLEVMSQKMAEYQTQLAAHKQNEVTSKMGVYGCEQAIGVLNWAQKNFGGSQ